MRNGECLVSTKLEANLESDRSSVYKSSRQGFSELATEICKNQEGKISFNQTEQSVIDGNYASRVIYGDDDNGDGFIDNDESGVIINENGNYTTMTPDSGAIKSINNNINNNINSD